jgi:site-specific DNA-adenine methylase
LQKKEFKVASYGIPYMGSKNKIVKKLLEVIPAAQNFYDLFGGGGCVSHYIATNCRDKWPNVYYNEIDMLVVDLMRDAISGKYNYEVFKPNFISREDFIVNKDTCGYTKLCWSFGNNGITYLFGKDIEDIKRDMHNAVIFDKFSELFVSTWGVSEWPVGMDIKQRRFHIRMLARQRGLQQFKRLQQLEQLERLQQFERFQQQPFVVTNLDYRNVGIKPNSVIYCDIPYQNTAQYTTQFHRESFLDWAAECANPVFVSEYGISDIRFTEVFQIDKIQSLKSNLKSGKRRVYVEKLYANKVGLDFIRGSK